MEERIQYIVENWEVILEAAISLVLYFIVFLFSAKVNGTKVNLTALFKEKVPLAESKFLEAKQKYDDASTEIAALKKELVLYKKELALYKKALYILIEEEDAEDGPTREN